MFDICGTLGLFEKKNMKEEERITKKQNQTGLMVSPDSVAPEDAILVAFRGRLPLDHDGLVGPAAGNDVLRRSARRLLWQRDAEGHTHTQV